jgi:hypothetical protein
MNKALLWLVSVALIGSPVIAGASDWRTSDTYREASYLVLHTADWGQTLDIADQCDEPGGTTEGNPLLSDCPSRSEVNRAILLSAAAHYAVSRSLPPKHRKWWQRLTITAKVGAVMHNYSVGLRVRF